MHERPRNRVFARVGAMVIASTVALPSTAWGAGRKAVRSEPASAASPAPTSPSPAATPPAGEASGTVDMAEVKRIYDEGKAKYDTLDYNGAIEAWTRAYGMTPPTDEYREARNDLAYNIATAQEKAYDIDRKVEHLRQARGLLVSFVDEYKKLYAPTDEAKAEVERVKERIAALDARIAAAEQQPAATPPPAKIKSQSAAIREVFRNDPELYRRYRSGRGMIIGGAVSLSIGAVLLIGAIAVADRDQFPNGTPVAISLGVIGGAGIVAGATLLGFGVPKRKRALREAQSRVVVAPTFSTHTAGLGVMGRF